MTTTKYATLVDAMLAAPKDRTFISMWHDEDEIETVTFGEFSRLARIQAADFIAHDVAAGDKVIMVMPQGIPLMVSFAAAMLAGAVPSIMSYPTFKVEPAKYRFGLSGVSRNLSAKLVVLDEQFPEDLLDYVTCGDNSKIVRHVAPGADAPTPTLPDFRRDSGSVAFIQHSAGTTGLQKGVALSHAAVLTQLDHLVSAIRLSDDDRIYSWLPLYHDMGLIACFMLPLVYHLPVVMQSPTDWVMRPGSMLSLMSEYRCTLSWIPNFTLQFLARRVPLSQRANLDLSSVRMLINCSEPVREQSIQEFYSAYSQYGLRPEALQASYAMAENVFAVTQSGNEPGAVPSRVCVDAKRLMEAHVAEIVDGEQKGAICLVSSGPCIPGSRVRIIAANGEEVPDGHVGEIAIHSDSLFDGYYNRPDLTEKAIKAGWYWSGDLGFVLDEQLYVVGRKSDLIIVAGKNLYPQDIEEITCSHSSIHDGRAVAFGLFNPDLGTDDIVVVAEVKDESELRNSASIEQAIRNAVVGELGVTVRGVYLRPPKWIVKSTAGKAARSTTREKLLQEQPELRGT